MEAGTSLVTLTARFRTHERAMQAYRLLEEAVHPSLPEHEGDGGYPWVMTIAYDMAEQPLVLDVVGRYGGVTFQEGE